MGIKKEGYADMVIRIPKEYHNLLRKLSYLTEKSMTEIVRSYMIEQLNNEKKLLTNADIVL